MKAQVVPSREALNRRVMAVDPGKACGVAFHRGARRWLFLTLNWPQDVEVLRRLARCMDTVFVEDFRLYGLYMLGQRIWASEVIGALHCFANVVRVPPSVVMSVSDEELREFWAAPIRGQHCRSAARLVYAVVRGGR